MDSEPRPHTTLNLKEAQIKAPSPAQDASHEQLRRSNSPRESVFKPSKKRLRSPEDDTSTAMMEIPKLQEPVTDDLPARNQSPWGFYTRVLDLDFSGSVTVAARKHPRAGLVAIRVFPSAAAEKTLYRYRHIKHENIVTVLEAFATETSLHIVLEHLPISLAQIVEGIKYPTEMQLAAILKQILGGLAFLEREDLEHGSLNCENILLSTQGDIKIANQQCCEVVRGGEPRDVRALSVITMELMQKYVKDDGAVGVDNLSRWPSDCDAVAFLSNTTSAASARDLQNILNRHSFLGPWTPAGVIVHIAYISANISCLEFWKLTATEVGLRAANLGLINMMPLFLGTHLSFLADRLGVSLKTFRMVHRSAGMVSFALGLLHVLVVVARGLGSFSLTLPQDLYGVIGGSAFCVLVLLSIPILRRPSYELFLRTHQALAILVTYSTIQHLRSTSELPWKYVYIFAGVVAALFIFQSGTVISRNLAWGRRFSGAYITRVHDTVKIRIKTSQRVDVKEGQYINLWIPFVSWYIFQSHPFVVTNWVDGKQDTLELFVQPKRGLTRRLFTHATLDARDSTPRLAFFSGPHGISIPVVEYETVLMVATGFGIATQLPYLRKLIHGYQTCHTRTRRVHLVWQLQSLDIGMAAESLLNDALDEDTVDDSYILCISIYVDSNDVSKVPFGKRATIHPGVANLEAIIHEEVSGKYLKRIQIASEERGKVFVTVSGNGALRDQLRALVRPHLSNGARLQELEFQPE